MTNITDEITATDKNYNGEAVSFKSNTVGCSMARSALEHITKIGKGRDNAKITHVIYHGLNRTEVTISFVPSAFFICDYGMKRFLEESGFPDSYAMRYYKRKIHISLNFEEAV